MDAKLPSSLRSLARPRCLHNDREKKAVAKRGKKTMVSREQKRAALYEKLQLLRSITNSHALSKTSIIIDATKYIEELKQKVDRLNQDMALEQTSAEQEQDSMAMKVTVETLDRGFLVNVFSEKSSPGMLVSILEAFEELGLSVIEAKASCTDSFHLEAVGGEEQDESLDAQVVKRAVLQAIKSSSGDHNED